jgi:hypothetical protein
MNNSRFLNSRINRSPLRSPSPDIAHKNIITTTKSPTSEIHQKILNPKSTSSLYPQTYPNDVAKYV